MSVAAQVRNGGVEELSRFGWGGRRIPVPMFRARPVSEAARARED